MIITPDMIQIKKHYFDTFSHTESENSARWLVEFAQQQGSWKPFTQEQIDKFSRHDFRFNGLVQERLIKKSGNLYHFTHEFVARLFHKQINRKHPLLKEHL